MGGSQRRGTVKGGPDKDALASRRASSMPRTSNYKLSGNPKWSVAADYKPPRKISDKELEAARKMFFDLDRDGSGSIDADELGVMLRSLGQNPTEQELHDLIESVDDGDKDGQIQLREFIKLYTEGLDARGSGRAGKEDVNNIFAAFGGDNSKEGATVDKAAIVEQILEQYDLEVNFELSFGKHLVSGASFSKEDITKIMEPDPPV